MVPRGYLHGLNLSPRELALKYGETVAMRDPELIEPVGDDKRVTRFSLYFDEYETTREQSSHCKCEIRPRCGFCSVGQHECTHLTTDHSQRIDGSRLRTLTGTLLGGVVCIVGDFPSTLSHPTNVRRRK